MSSGDESDDANMGFKYKQDLTITNKALKLCAHIKPQFIKKVGGDNYVSIDFYNSRGVYNILSCRSTRTGTQQRSLSKVMATLTKQIRKREDEQFRKMVVQNQDAEIEGRPIVFSKDRGIVPRHKRGRALAFALDIVNFTLPEVPGVLDEVNCKSYLIEIKRKNRNRPLWLNLSPKVIDYISKWVEHEALKCDEGHHDTSSEDDDIGDDIVDLPAHDHENRELTTSNIEKPEIDNQPSVEDRPVTKRTIVDLLRVKSS